MNDYGKKENVSAGKSSSSVQVGDESAKAKNYPAGDPKMDVKKSSDRSSDRSSERSSERGSARDDESDSGRDADYRDGAAQASRKEASSAAIPQEKRST